MPIYEYQCSKCDLEFERIAKLHEDDPDCPICGSSSKKMMSAPGGFVMKSSQTSQGTCCGMSNPCDSPKSCCGKG